MTEQTASPDSKPRAHAAVLRERIERLQLMLFDALEKITITVTTPPADAKPPVEVERRIIANAFEMWRLCARSRCQRSRCCKGEPLHCLHAGILMLPPDSLDAFAAARLNGRRRRRF